MNTAEFITLLQNPSQVTSSQTRALDAIVEQFPYMQSARAMQLKGLKDANSFSYNKELKMTAAHTVDRSILFDYITSPEFTQNEVASQLQSREEYLRNITVFEPQEVVTKKSIAIDDAIKMKLKEAHQVLDEDLFEVQKTEESSDEKDNVMTAETVSTEEKLGVGKPLEFTPSESHSFAEWLKLTAVKPIERAESEEKPEPKTETQVVDAADSEKQKKFELIDNFIANNPKIVPQKKAPVALHSDLPEIPKESLMTATLARVYLEQKNYKKAIQAYKILILKNPEKSSFFADQIREIENLIEKH